MQVTGWPRDNGARIDAARQVNSLIDGRASCRLDRNNSVVVNTEHINTASRCDDAVMSSAGAREPETSAPDHSATVIRISKMAHFAPAFVALSVVVFIPVLGNWALTLLTFPALAAVAIARLQTVADPDTVTARGLFSSRTLPWSDVEGLKFSRGGWARACRPDGAEVLLPAVTFATLPRLTAASGGRVPNPYEQRRPGSGKGVDAVQEKPGGDAAAGSQHQS
jgi:hypothetical protein